MAAPTYPTEDSAWARILERAWGLDTDETYAREMLLLSRGVDSESPPVGHYRAWYVGAKLIEQNLETQAITEGDGAKFTRLQPVIESLLQIQRNYDVANGLTIPEGFEAIPASCDPCDTKNQCGGGSTGGYRPRTVRTVTRL